MQPPSNGPHTGSPRDGWTRRVLRSMGELNAAIFQIVAAMAEVEFSEKEQFAVRLSLEEAIVNALKHGNREDPAKQVTVEFQVNTREIVARIVDEGPGFNPNTVPDPLAPENIERPGGRGIFLMRHYMTSVQFNDRGNAVTLSKARGT